MAQSFRLKLIGVLLSALFVFLTVSLLGYSSADVPGSQVFPRPVEIRNFCGPVGAFAAWILLDVFGWATVCLLPVIGFTSFRLLSGQAVDQILLRTFGLGLVLFGFSGLCGLFAEPLADVSNLLRSGPNVGPGGYLGASAALLLTRYVSLLGSSVLLVSFTAAGLVLLDDRTLLRVLRLFSAKNQSQATTVLVSEKIETEFPEEFDEANDDETAFEEPEEAPGGFMGWLRNAKPNRMERQAQRTDRPEVESAQVPQSPRTETYRLPSAELLKLSEPFDEESYVEVIRQQAERLEAAFADFGLDIQVVDILTGPVISQFELRLAKGLRVNKVQALENDLAIAMKVPSVRIVSPIPGKNAVGVELPNTHRQTVLMRDVMELAPEMIERFNIPIFLGKDVSGNPMVVDLTKLPHLLIAGRTGTGKSVCLNSIIVSMLMTRSPDQVRMLMIDPKMVELSPYGTIPHLMHPVVTDMRKAEAILAWAVDKMEQRYQLLAAAGVRQLSEYNKLSEADLRRRMKMLDCSDEEWAAIPKSMPYLIIVADEMADLMMTAAKEVETHIIRLAQKSRAVGIHLVLATQKPTVDIVTGLIKSNLPARIAFGVASRTDSLVVLDKTGAERLLGNGDMLFLQPGTNQALRGQGTYVGDAEIESIIETIGTEDHDFVEELIAIDPDALDASPAAPPATGGVSKQEDDKIQRDELYYEAVEYIIQEGRGSLSLLQRRFSIGYGRAARLIDFMAEDGVVGSYNGSQAREVLITLSDWKRRQRQGGSQTSQAAGTRVVERKAIPIKPAVRPTLIDTSKEPRRGPKYPEPKFYRPEEEDDAFDEEYEDEYEYAEHG